MNNDKENDKKAKQNALLAIICEHIIVEMLEKIAKIEAILNDDLNIVTLSDGSEQGNKIVIESGNELSGKIYEILVLAQRLKRLEEEYFDKLNQRNQEKDKHETD